MQNINADRSPLVTVELFSHEIFATIEAEMFQSVEKEGFRKSTAS